MNIHKNARLTLVRRVEMVEAIANLHLSIAAAAEQFAVSATTARKWFGRYLSEGLAGLEDKSSRPEHSPRAIPAKQALTIIELRKKRMTQARIADYLQVSKATVSRVLSRAGLAKLGDIDPPPPVQRYEHAHPGDLLHIDTKKLGRIEKMGHRATGSRRQRANGAGWEVLFIAVDDHARIAFTELYADETQDSACRFLDKARAYYASLGIRVRSLLTDNGSAFRSTRFKQACTDHGIKHRYTRPYRPQTNGKAERFIQSALREWAYGFAYSHSDERAALLPEWTHHYNWHRPHQGIGGIAPMARLSQNRNNLLQLHT